MTENSQFPKAIVVLGLLLAIGMATPHLYWACRPSAQWLVNKVLP